MEIWKAIPNFEGVYEASNFGNIRRLSRGKLFSAEQIKQAKEMLNNGAKLKEVALFLNTSITTVMSIKHGKTWSGDETQRPMKFGTINSGYHIVHLCKNGKYTRSLVHRLIWKAFYGEIPERLEVNHKDLNKTNNCIENLELVTHQENLLHVFNLRKRRPNKVKNT